MSEPLPTGLPVLVRKLRRKRHWHSSAAREEEQVAEVLTNVFLFDKRPYSLYQVGSETELDRVALALNAGRDSLSEECFFVYFTLDEAQAAGVPLSPTAGDTPCQLVNSQHFDADATETQLRALVSRVKAAQRGVCRRSRSQMKKVVEQATQEQCLAAVPESTECQVPACPKPPS